MGPEMGSRTFDKLDFILFLLVLLLRVSLRILALARHLLCLFHCFYNYFFNQALFCGVHHEVLPTISFMYYLGIKFSSCFSFTRCILSHHFFPASRSSSAEDYYFGHDYCIAFTIQPLMVDQSEKSSQTQRCHVDSDQDEESALIGHHSPSVVQILGVLRIPGPRCLCSFVSAQ